MEIRAFTEKDAEDTAKVIAETLRISNRRDYTAEQIEAIIAGLSAEELVKVSKERHMYVICDGERIIGTGGIAGYWGSLTESILLTIFILPEYQGKGIGRKLIETLEKDEYFLRAKRIEIPARGCGGLRFDFTEDDAARAEGFGKPDIARAIIESAAYLLRDNLEKLRGIGLRADRITAIGGITNSAVCTGIISDVLERKISVVNGQSAGAVGSCLLAGIGTGVFGGEKEAFETMKGRLVV